MPGRLFTAQTSYRYGFNGKEKDLETTETTTYDYGFRIYNPGLGKFLSVDPLTGSYPYYSPYHFAGNMPIAAVDLDGLEQYVVIHYKNQKGNTYKTVIRVLYDKKGEEKLDQLVTEAVIKNGEVVERIGSKIATENVLVFDVQKNKNNKEIVTIESLKTLSTEDAMIYRKYHKMEDEEDEEQSLAYGKGSGEFEFGKKSYASEVFFNSETVTYAAIYEKPNPKKVGKKLPISTKPSTITIGHTVVKKGESINLGIDFLGRASFPIVGILHGLEAKIGDIPAQMKNSPNLKITISGFVLLGTGQTLNSIVDNEGSYSRDWQYSFEGKTYRELAQGRINTILKFLKDHDVDMNRVKTSVPTTGHTQQRVTLTVDK